MRERERERERERAPRIQEINIVYRYSHYGKQYGKPTKKKKIGLLYDPPVPLLGIYPKGMKTLIQKDIFTLMFIATLFTIAKP